MSGHVYRKSLKE